MGYTTPAEWLPYLTKQLDAQVTENARFRAFADGTQPGPEMTSKSRASWIRFQKRARVIFARLIAESLAGRITPTSVKVNGEDDDPAVTKAQLAARKIWRRSRLDVGLADLILDALIVGRGFLVVAADAFGRAVITVETADQMYAVADPLDPTNVTAAVKVWRDDVASRDYARVWTGSARQDFTRTSLRTNSKALRTTNSGGWEPLNEEVPATGVPVAVVTNRGDTSEFGYSLDVLDRIMLGILQRLTITAYQAARLRAVKGLSAEDAEDTDVQTAIFDLSPGALIDLPEGAELWEGQTTDIGPLLMAVKDDIRELAASTSTPLSALIPDGANQSAEGALAAREAQILKALDRQKRWAPPIEGALLKAIRIELGDDFDDDVEVTWMNPALSTPNERTNAATQAASVGIPFHVIATDFLGYTPEQADTMQTRREDESLLLSLAQPAPPAATAA